MLVEADRLIIVAVQQAFAMQPGLVDQPREMDIAPELFVRTPRMSLSLQRRRAQVAGTGWTAGAGRSASFVASVAGCASGKSSACRRSAWPMTRPPEKIPPLSIARDLAVTFPSSTPVLWIFTAPVATISADIRPLISMLATVTRR